ncbi:MAG: glucose-6-phosphate isomerase [Candidatus Cloacimonadales bacterium]
MMKNIDPTKTTAWQKLTAHQQALQNIQMRDLFAQDKQRFDKFHIQHNEILLDYSKNIITEETMQLLYQMAEECELKDAIRKIFAGDKINLTENRAVLHTALRSEKTQLMVDGKNIMPQIRRVQQQMQDFSEQIRSGDWLGFGGKPITDIVNIGIGGSDLGPQMVCEALKFYWEDITPHFISNIDGSDLAETLKDLDPETTLFMIASKTFTTQETMTNAHSARDWFLQFTTRENIPQHFVAISTNQKGVEDFGISGKNMFEFWDWVGGRYSLWSAIGLSIACTVGYQKYAELLAGAATIDQHFQTAEFATNIPVNLALLGIWYNNFMGAETVAILPYNQYLHRFPAYLQQADMESNGKSISRRGEAVNYQTGPIIWGEPGTNGQHAFFQLLHQGSKLIPADFIAAINPLNNFSDHHPKLLANFLAQTQALMQGKSAETVRAELENSGKTSQEISQILPFKVFAGNHPSNSILLKKLTPHNLGALIAIYEHKIFVQGVIWNIFSFDQWGVELGKQLAQKILPQLQSEAKCTAYDSSTNNLINICQKWV